MVKFSESVVCSCGQVPALFRTEWRHSSPAWMPYYDVNHEIDKFLMPACSNAFTQCLRNSNGFRHRLGDGKTSPLPTSRKRCNSLMTAGGIVNVLDSPFLVVYKIAVRALKSISFRADPNSLIDVCRWSAPPTGRVYSNQMLCRHQ